MSDPDPRAGPDEPRDDEPRDDEPRIRAEAVVRGRVQGVGYRFFAARSAADLGLGGWVVNEPDGSVRCLVDGHGPVVEAFLRELARGPHGSSVTAVDVVRTPSPAPIARFEIRSGWHSGD